MKSLNDTCAGCNEFALCPDYIGVVVEARDVQKKVLSELHFKKATFCDAKCLSKFGVSMVHNGKLPIGTKKVDLIPINNLLRV